jgi:hypothetical protein
MSHFTVTIIGTNVEEQLEPFNENIVMEKYVKFTKEALVADERKNLEDYKNGMYHVYIDFIFPMRLNRIVVRQQLEGKG